MRTPLNAGPSLDSLLDRYEERTHLFRPDEARELGLHQYDGHLAQIGRDARRSRLLFLQEMMDGLGPNPVGLDARLFHQALRSEVWRLSVQRKDETDPMHAADLVDPSCYLRWDYAPWEERARALQTHLEQIPAFLDAVRDELEAELSAPAVNTALSVFKGLESFVRSGILQAAHREGPLPRGLESCCESAADAVERHLQFLEKEAIPRAHQDFAMGTAGLEGMLREQEGLDLELDEVVRAGEDELNRNRSELEELCREYRPRAKTKDVLGSIAKDVSWPMDLRRRGSLILDELYEFVQERELVSIPSDGRPQIDVTPPWMRWAIASLEDPGPFAPAQLRAWYYVTPPEESWSAARKQRWLAMFNDSSLRVITGHEVMPGHFLHALHVRRAPSRASRLFAVCYHFWEGWAHYGEQLLAEESFREGDLKFAINQRHAALERSGRLMCSVGLHSQSWSLAEAKRFLTGHCYVNEVMAQCEAERGCFDPQYLGYTLGKLLLIKLREDVRKIEKDRFSLKSFHDRVLSVGAPPISLLREEVFGLRDRKLL